MNAQVLQMQRSVSGIAFNNGSIALDALSNHSITAGPLPGISHMS
jgi:hypothetical protein